MYIGSTNLYMDFMNSNTKVPENWITSEKYENCEDFYQYLVVKHNRPKFFRRKK